MTRCAPALVVLLGACTMPNPDYEGGDELADGSSGDDRNSDGETSETSDSSDSSDSLEGSTDDASEANDTSDTTSADSNDATSEPSETSTGDPASCGNGITEAGEECDDANPDDTDACTSQCTGATCGDGFIHAGFEECDDANMDDGDECTSQCTAATCGDGFVHTGVEFCDDTNVNELDGCPASCNLDYRIVFVTSLPIGGGSIGGLMGADEYCKGLATQAGLSGNYLAWLSDGVQSPSSRFPESTVPYKLRNGAHVAESWDDLVNGPLANPININEAGGPPPMTGNSQCGSTIAWTSTSNAGGPLMPNCEGFSDANAYGLVGNVQSNEQWTACVGSQPKCDKMGVLYCFQA
jgi:cysteine-rich repeat protein